MALSTADIALALVPDHAGPEQAAQRIDHGVEGEVGASLAEGWVASLACTTRAAQVPDSATWPAVVSSRIRGRVAIEPPPP